MLTPALARAALGWNKSLSVSGKEKERVRRRDKAGEREKDIVEVKSSESEVEDRVGQQGSLFDNLKRNSGL